RATLGVFGREEQNSSEEKIEQPKQTTERSFTNRISFGLLDRPETQQNINTETE
ncbi:MAG TPA: outer membrane protein assembly factor BamD, partial [Acinetobacter johnsonii]|nr:outer membrane protein assembly factor BamD [Acinetobacter johnsonii]